MTSSLNQPMSGTRLERRIGIWSFLRDDQRTGSGNGDFQPPPGPASGRFERWFRAWWRAEFAVVRRPITIRKTFREFCWATSEFNGESASAAWAVSFSHRMNV